MIFPSGMECVVCCGSNNHNVMHNIEWLLPVLHITKKTKPHLVMCVYNIAHIKPHVRMYYFKYSLL